MSDYTPTIDQLRDWYTDAAGRMAAPGEFDRALAAHVAEKRAEWEAEQTTEYLMRTPGGSEFDTTTPGKYLGARITSTRKVTPWLPVTNTESEGTA